MSTDIRPRYSPTRVPYDPYYRNASPVHRVVHERSYSPTRAEVVHTGPPQVEKVFEKSTVVGAVATDEQRAHCQELQREAEQMRQRMNDYSNLVDNLRNLQSSLNLLNDENRLRVAEYTTRGDATGNLVNSVKQELEDQKGLLQKTRDQNTSLHEELDMQEDYLNNRNVEIARSKSEIDASQTLNKSLQLQSNSQIDQLNKLKEGNASLVVQIGEQQRVNDIRTVECNDLTLQVNTLESHQASLVHRNDDLNNVLKHKTGEVSDHETVLRNCELEINTLNGQIQSFQSQLKNLRALEEKLVTENQGLQNQNLDEGHRNVQLSSGIHDFADRCKLAESRVLAMRSELEACKNANAHNMDGNTNLQSQVSSLNNHISVVTGQNAALTGELNQFVQANEALRLQLDRRARVEGIRVMNEEKIMQSTAMVHEQRSRSPLRGRLPPPHEPVVVGLARVPVFEDRTIEVRSRSPLLGRTHGGPGGYDQPRMSAVTPTISRAQDGTK